MASRFYETRNIGIIIWSVTGASISRAKRLGLETLDKIFSANPQDPRWKISWPTETEMNRYSEMVYENTTNEFEAEVVDGVFGFMDGLNLPIYNPEDPDIQNAYYNGWLSGTFCSQVLVFTPDGRVCFVK